MRSVGGLLRFHNGSPPPVPDPGERRIPRSPIQLGVTATGPTRWVPLVAGLVMLLLVVALILLVVT
jgi:hypothetical protein